MKLRQSEASGDNNREVPRVPTTEKPAMTTAPVEMAGPGSESEKASRWEALLNRLPTETIVGAIEAVRDASKKGSELLEQAGDQMGHQFIRYYGPEITAVAAEALRKLQKIRLATALASAAVMLAASSNPELVTAVGLQIDHLIQATAVGLGSLGLGPHEVTLATNMLHDATDLLHMRLTAHAAGPEHTTVTPGSEGPSEARFVHLQPHLPGETHPPDATTQAETVTIPVPYEATVSPTDDFSEQAAQREAAGIKGNRYLVEPQGFHTVEALSQRGWDRVILPDGKEAWIGLQQGRSNCLDSALATAADQIGALDRTQSFDHFEKAVGDSYNAIVKLKPGESLKIELPQEAGGSAEIGVQKVPLDDRVGDTTLSDVIKTYQRALDGKGEMPSPDLLESAQQVFTEKIRGLMEQGRAVLVWQHATRGEHTGAVIEVGDEQIKITDGSGIAADPSRGFAGFLRSGATQIGRHEIGQTLTGLFGNLTTESTRSGDKAVLLVVSKN